MLLKGGGLTITREDRPRIYIYMRRDVFVILNQSSHLSCQYRQSLTHPYLSMPQFYL